MSAMFPVNLILEKRSVLVVGGGTVAARKTAALLAARANVTCVAPEGSDEMNEAVLGGQVTLVNREFIPSDLDGKFFVVAATNDASVNSDVFAEAERRGIFCNAVDDVANCSATLVSVVRRGELVLTASTNCKSPSVSKHVAKKLEESFGEEYAELVELCAELRTSLKDRGFSSESSGWESAFDRGLVDLLRDGKQAKARELLTKCLFSALV